MGKLLASLPKKNDPNLLVGYETSDDAGVYRLSDEQAIVVTADFITPPVDDPFVFGQIGAANSISDIYAMGGRPVTCLNLIGFPADDLGPEILHGIVEGALSKITEAGAVLAGGHTTDDEEPKFGLSVTGVVHPDRFWRNIGARAGDVLILTKPVGSGVLFNANLKGRVSEGALKACIDTITTLNRVACETALAFDVHAATDITGFGLAGHSYEMAKGSGITIVIDADRVPMMDEALDMYRGGVTTGVNGPNRALVDRDTEFAARLDKPRQEILVDPQTSGGLLLAVPGEQGDRLVAALHEAGVEAAVIIGEVKARTDGPFLRFI